mgnify:CR=1 FL=1
MWARVACSSGSYSLTTASPRSPPPPRFPLRRYAAASQQLAFFEEQKEIVDELKVELIDPSNLDNIVPAIAITIHKSQGSESEKVSILWLKKSQLDKSINNVKRESENIFFRDDYEKRLLYTAITRAKKLLDIYYLN